MFKPRRWYAATILAGALVAFAIFVGLVMASPNKETTNSLYAVNASITTIDEMRGRIGATDSRQLEWYWYGSFECRLNDTVILIMNSQGTEYIFDDFVESISMANTES